MHFNCTGVSMYKYICICSRECALRIIIIIIMFMFMFMFMLMIITIAVAVSKVSLHLALLICMPFLAPTMCVLLRIFPAFPQLVYKYISHFQQIWHGNFEWENSLGPGGRGLAFFLLPFPKMRSKLKFSLKIFGTLCVINAIHCAVAFERN